MGLSSYPTSYYAATANSEGAYPALEGEVQADVCVIGAGFTGLSSALHLAEKGYSVTVLDAEKVGWGASGRNGGQLSQGQRIGHDEIVEKVGREAADVLWDLSLDSVDLVKDLIKKHNIQCDLKSGVMHVAAKPSHIDDIKEEFEYYREVLKYNDVKYVDKQDVEGMLGTDKYHNGLVMTDGAHLHPLNYALGLADAAVAAGVKIYENSRVTSYKGGDGAEVITEKGVVKAKYILLACNGYLGNLAPKWRARLCPLIILFWPLNP